MKTIDLYCGAIEVRLDTGPDIRDITTNLNRLVQASRITDGNLIASMVGSTGSLTTIEYEPGVVEDLKRAINRLAPPGEQYAHEQAWHDGNGHSHLQATLMGPSLSVPVTDGALVLGTWQQIFHLDCDVKSRRRTIVVTVMGE